MNRLVLDNRFRIIACLLATVLILSFAPFIMRPSAKEADEQITEVIEPIETPKPSEFNEIEPVQTPVIISMEPAFQLTNNQQYIQQLVSEDSTNILVCAPDPSGWNMDTILIVSMDKSSDKVMIISFPRDIYIDYNQSFIDSVDLVAKGLVSQPGMQKINAAHAIGDKIHYKEGIGRFDRPYIEFLADVIEEVFTIHIDDYVYLQTKGFRRIIDYFGGVKIYVPVRMNYQDTVQGLDINLQKGSQILDGYQSEGFVRFRQGYDDNGVFNNYGDLFRKENQSKFLQSFIQQHLTLRNLTRLSEISDFIGKNIITSIQGWSEIVSYGAIAENFLARTHSIETGTIQGAEGRKGYLSYFFIQQEEVQSVQDLTQIQVPINN